MKSRYNWLLLSDVIWHSTCERSIRDRVTGDFSEACVRLPIETFRSWVSRSSFMSRSEASANEMDFTATKSSTGSEPLLVTSTLRFRGRLENIVTLKKKEKKVKVF